MRIRRKAWVRPELEECKFFIDNPKDFIGKWNELFNNNNKIHMELGCGKGSFIANIASLNKNINYIAIDIKSEMLGLAKRNIEKVYASKNLEIDNVFLTACNIEQIDTIIGCDDSIEKIYINFCNPWPREKHKKRRLTHIRQLEKYKNFLIDNGSIYFKTDDDNLFEESIEYFKEIGFNIDYITYDLHSENNIDFNIETEHEKMFSEKGIKIKFLIATLK